MIAHLKKCVLMIFIVLVSACGQELTVEEHINNAKSYIENRELNAALIELKNALSKDQQNPETRLLLAKVFYASGNFSNAEVELDKVIKTRTLPNDALPLLAKSLNRQSKHAEVMLITTEGLSNGAQGEILASKALANLAKDNKNLAERQIASAIRKNPYSPYILTTQAKSLTLKHNFDEAKKLTLKIIEDNADYAPAYSLLGSIEQTQGNWSAAEDAFIQAVKLDTFKYPNILKLAYVQIIQKKYDVAYSNIESYLQNNPKNPEINYLVGLIKYYQGEYQASLNALAYTSEQSQPRALFYQAAAYLQLGRLLQAERAAEKFYKYNPTNIKAVELLASIKLRAKDFSGTERIITPLALSEQNDLVSNKIFAAALLSQGKVKQALPVLEKIETQHPNEPEIQSQLASAYFMLGRTVEGVKHSESAINLNPSSAPAYRVLIGHYLKNGELNTAINIANQLIKEAPDSAEAQILLAQIYLTNGQSEKAKSHINDALKIDPDNIVATNYLIDNSMQNKDFKTARDLAEKLQKTSNQNLATTLKLAALDFLDGDTSSTLATLEQAVSDYPDSLEAKIKLARFHLAQGTPEEAESLLDNVQDEQSSSQLFLETKALIKLANSEFISAKSTIDELIALTPNDSNAYYYLSLARAGLRDENGREEALLKALSISPGHQNANIHLIQLLLRQNKLDRAESQLDAFSKFAPSKQIVNVLQAALFEKQGNDRKALNLYQQIFDESKTGKNVLILAAKKAQLNDTKGAISLLETFVAKHEMATSVRFALANLYSQANQISKSNEQLERILQTDSDNPAVLNNLAWNLRQTDSSKALQYAKKAHQLKPSSSNILGTLSEVQLANGDIESAKRNVERALKISPTDPSLLQLQSKISNNRE